MTPEDFQTLIDSVGNMALSAAQGLASEVRIEAARERQTAIVTAYTPEKLTDDQFDELLSRLIAISDFYYDDLALEFYIRPLTQMREEDSRKSKQTCEFAYSG